MTIKLVPETAALLMFSIVHAPLEGLRWSDFSKLEQLKALMKLTPGEEGRDVTVPFELVQMLKACWANAPAGRMQRFDGLVEHIQALDEAMKG